jgi:hypothetical protein
VRQKRAAHEGRKPKGTADQCEECPSSFELVEKKSEAKKTTTMSGTTKKGEVMCMALAP